MTCDKTALNKHLQDSYDTKEEQLVWKGLAQSPMEFIKLVLGTRVQAQETEKMKNDSLCGPELLGSCSGEQTDIRTPGGGSEEAKPS